MQKGSFQRELRGTFYRGIHMIPLSCWTVYTWSSDRMKQPTIPLNNEITLYNSKY